MRFRFLVFLVCGLLLSNCSSNSTPISRAEPSPTLTQTTTELPTTVAIAVPSATPNVLGLNIVAQFDATARVLTIYGITPGATIVYAGTPLLPPPPPTQTNTPAPTETSSPTSTPPPRVVVPRPTLAPTVPITAAALRGRIVFKSSRDGGSYPVSYAFYSMNPDGTGVQRLDLKSMNSLYIQLQSREGVSPDGSQVALGERHCYSSANCAVYILDTTLDARLINSSEDISHGQWFPPAGSGGYKGYQSKDPVWSPAGSYIVFASNNEIDAGCIRTTNIYKGPPTQKPTIRRLSQFCSGSDAGHPSFNADGSKVVFWSQDTGLHQIYMLDVGSDDSFDYRFANPRKITDGKWDDWDPLWVK